MDSSFKSFSEIYLSDFETFLLSHIQSQSGTNLEDAMNYSLDAEGKRLRPLLLLAVLNSFGEEVSKGYPAAAGLEMIHTYSLIHDDLPAMDDDVLRRGKPTNHIQFDEATAILAGDALLTLAFEVITFGEIEAALKVKLIKLLAETAGYKGMVGGQKADLDGENSSLNLGEIEQIHLRKTGALIKMATVASGIIANKSDKILSLLEDFALEIGIVYQIRDDILDVVGTEEELGKKVAKDAKLGKSTYPALLGLEESFEALATRLDKAKYILNKIQAKDSAFDSELLIDFVELLALKEYK